jgi:elongation factor 3
MCPPPTAIGEVAKVDSLRAAFEAASNKSQREAALQEITTYLSNRGKAVEPFVGSKQLLPSILKAFGDKEADVRAAAYTAGAALMGILNPNNVAVILPVLFEAMTTISTKWQTKVGALQLLGDLAAKAPDHVAVCLPDIVPAVTDCAVDVKEQLKTAATEALTICCGAVGNRDIEPFIPSLVSCIARPEEVPDCVHKLGATTFVQAVDAKTLSIMVPLLQRGMIERTTAIRRKCCVIIDNMAKLVDDPVDASEFVSAVKPGVETVVREMSNPEARSVAEKALKTLIRVAEDAGTDKTRIRCDVPELLAELKTVVAAAAPAAATLDVDGEAVALYVAGLCASLTDVKEFEEEEWKKCVVPYLAPIISDAAATSVCHTFLASCKKVLQKHGGVVEEEEEGEDLCNCEFSLAYGAKILLNNTRLHMKRGQRYGLCGPNGAGKSTLMRAIANGQVDGFPPKDELRTIYVEHDIDGNEADTPVVEFVYKDPTLQDASHPSHGKVEEVLTSVGFTPQMLGAPVASLSGGWKMKLALARAMLMNADILLLDEPTNHLDVTNVAWLKKYLCSLTNVTSLIVSHDSSFLDDVCTGIIHYENRKLKKYRGNLAELVKHRPEAKAYYSLGDTTTAFSLPEPGFLEGVTSKDRAILKMRGVAFKYATSDGMILDNVTLQCSLNSRVACVGPNGAGKSTMIKLLTGELEPVDGMVWKHPNMRVAYVAQHAFHHIEQHLDKTPNQYIQWRYATGEDREGLSKVDRTTTEEEEKKMKEVIKMEDGSKRVVERLLARRKLKQNYEYEVQWLNQAETSWLSRTKLEEMGFTKMLNDIDIKEAAAAGMMGRPLTAANVEKMLGELGLESEFASHSHIRGLSGGQKVKLVLGAAMWQQPHIVVLDEPTNYLDRESLGALANALKEFGGGVVVVSHSQEFLKTVCTEFWTVGGGKLEIEGATQIIGKGEKWDMARNDEVTDAFGNTIKVKGPKKELSRKEKKQMQKMKAARRARGEEVSDDEDD